VIAAVPALLARADAGTLAALVGEAGADLLGALGSGTPEALRAVALGLHGEHGLLADAAHRDALVRLLVPDEAAALARALGLDANRADDLADALLARPPRRGSWQQAALLDAFGVTVPPDAPAEPPPPAQTTAAPGYGLFAHQRRALREVSAALDAPPHRAVLHMPTGAGKTRTAMHAVARHLRERERGVVVWLVYGQELCEQAASEFERAWGALGDRPVETVRFWGERDLAIPADGLVVASLPKLYALAMRRVADLAALADAASLVVVDEAHQAVAATFALVLDGLTRATRTPLLGLTATPGRTWDDLDADETLARFFGGRKVMLRIDGHDNPVDALVADGYLARARFESLHHDGALGLTDREQARIAQAFDLPPAVLDRLADDERRNAAIVARTERLLGEHSRLLVFGATVGHADLLATVLRARGWEAYSVSSATPPAVRRLRLERYLSADTSRPVALCNYGILTTGFDAPRTSAALVARPTRSLVLYSQMVGRALRGPRAGGNAEATIVTVLDRDLPGFGSVAEAFTHWEDVWT
jgi:superfamily II DNA or RNA helicase